MNYDIAEIVQELATRAEDVCRHYLPAGRREGRCWRVGDARNTAGRSLYVRLGAGSSGRGAAGKWVDCATSEHGDLLDLIREARGLASLGDTLDEARRFLGRQPRGRTLDEGGRDSRYDPRRTLRRLLAESCPIGGTLAETYLHNRGVPLCMDMTSLRFHPACPCRDASTGCFSRLPALIALVTDVRGAVTGLQRTYLSRDGAAKADVPAPRRSVGSLLGHAVRFGQPHNVAIAGEGVETVLGLKTVLPQLPMLAALSATNLAALAWPAGLRRLYIARDRDRAGAEAFSALSARARRAGVEAIPLMPVRKDFNDDIMTFGPGAMLAMLRPQLLAQDVERNRVVDALGEAISPAEP